MSILEPFLSLAAALGALFLGASAWAALLWGRPSRIRRRISSGSPFEERIGYTRAVLDGDFIFVSGTTGYDYAAMRLPEGAADQAEQTFRNLQSALEQAGSSLEEVVRVTYILTDLKDAEACFPVFRRWFGPIRPAATLFEARLLDPAMKIEIEVTARRLGGRQ